MAITAAGVGSGLDIESIVSQLMTLERQPLVALQRKESATKAQVSAYGKIKSAVSSFQDAMRELSTVDKFKIFTATSSNEDAFTASASSSAAAGIYNLEVSRLAQNHKQGSDEFSDSATFGGADGDELTLSVGSDSATIDLSTASTLTEIRDAINSAEDNPGVTATILNTGDGVQRLVLTADESGYDDRVQLSYGGAISDTTFNFATTNQTEDVNGDLVTMTDLSELDAAYKLDGFDLTSASNNISGVMDGITIQLKQLGSGTLNVQRDTLAIEESAKNFIDAYNAVFDEIKTQREGDLAGDSTLLSIQRGMRAILNTPSSGLGGSFSSLSEVGIRTNGNTGKLELSVSSFSNALDADFAAVAELFANDDQGFAFRFESLADSYLANDGLIDIREDGLEGRIRDLQDDQNSMERRLELKEASLRSQFSALDTLVGSLQSTSSFLFQQLGV